VELVTAPFLCWLKRILFSSLLLFQLDIHRMRGTAETGKSSSAKAAANAMAPRQSMPPARVST
jgi:hypothetical protein